MKRRSGRIGAVLLVGAVVGYTCWWAFIGVGPGDLGASAAIANIVALPVAVAGLGLMVLQWLFSAMSGREAVPIARHVAAVLDYHRSQRAQLLEGDASAVAPVAFERELVQYRADEGGASGTFSGVLEYVDTLRTGRLVVLGGAGAGKTLLSFELVVRLLSERAPEVIAVRLPLSTWRRQPLAQWVASFLADRYGVPRDVADQWVTERRVLPVLDGLDETPGGRAGQAEVVEAVNNYYGSNTFGRVVLTSRPEDYDDLVRSSATGVLDATVVRIQPLDVERIREYVERRSRSTEEELRWLRVVARAEAEPAVCSHGRCPPRGGSA